MTKVNPEVKQLSPESWEPLNKVCESLHNALVPSVGA
jgi:hypothetical protein